MFESVDPKAAPLPWPTCRGPVGLLETYSINIFSFFKFFPTLKPNLFFSLLIVSSISVREAWERKILINPGPATSILSIKSCLTNSSNSFSAIFFGSTESCLEATKAKLEE